MLKSFFIDLWTRITGNDILEEPRTDVVVNTSNVIALVVGHNSHDQGATNYLKESEFSFNSRIARKLKLKLTANHIPSIVITRKKGSYSGQCYQVAEACRRVNALLSVHLHFNSASSKAKGCEVLIVPTASEVDNRFADKFTDILNEKYGFVERGNDGTKLLSSGHSGYGMMNAVRNGGTIPVLVEPCFAHYRSKESALIFESEDEYVNVLLSAIMEVV